MMILDMVLVVEGSAPEYGSRFLQFGSRAEPSI